MSTEHYCTMFDANFLPMGVALGESLWRHNPDAQLWVVCLDADTERALRRLHHPGLHTIALAELETAALKAARAERTPREYFWTLTPWMFEAVFDRCATAQRVTYLDADLYFFRPAAVLLDRMTANQQVLITHHAYAPEYDMAAVNGAFCVQFVTVRRTTEALEVVRWWRDRCLEWCYARAENGQFGDQRYLERWPAMLGEQLLVVNDAELTGAPWNASLAERREGNWLPVFYHFHGFRYLSDDRVLQYPLHPAYEIGPRTHPLYQQYVSAVRSASRALRRAGFAVAGATPPEGFEDYDPWTTVLRRAGRLLKRRLQPAARRPIVSVR
jgi:hypothetical protein